jgi:TonB family protein
MKIFWRFPVVAIASSMLILEGCASSNYPAIANNASAGANNACSSTSPQYPDASRRNGEYGTVIMRVLVDAGGIAHRAQVFQSSGHSRLDQSAIAWAMSCKFDPWTVDDSHPQTIWREMPFTFPPSQ